MMESVGVYGFCGCKAKNKMKCDSRWEIAASGPAWTCDLCSHTRPCTWFNAPLSPS
ncbi:heat shock protein family A (Hsp70) member 12A [Homo sapiens]|uniref:Heat shock protein family A (Hsp70) member 12A n=1 Tax=Homo sapiens TaxID=9606 RepID=A0A6I8PU93_HUMAN|nr:heat shock protein family A (Hsp70) member 12A [Homo sapiens]KAI4077590.1 heat shock protein family A (Hsp70) member 12A [Homo sapiens]